MVDRCAQFPEYAKLDDLAQGVDGPRALALAMRLLFLRPDGRCLGIRHDQDSGQPLSHSHSQPRLRNSTRTGRAQSVETNGCVLGVQFDDLSRTVAHLGGNGGRALSAFERELHEIHSALSLGEFGTSTESHLRVRRCAMGGQIVRAQKQAIDALSSGMPTGSALRSQRSMYRARSMAIGATGSVVLLFSAIADDAGAMRSMSSRASLVCTCEVIYAAMRDLRGEIERVDPTEGVLAAADEMRRFRRALAALRVPELAEHLLRLDRPDALRAEVAAFRQAAWPPSDAFDRGSRSSVSAYDANATLVGVRAGIAFAAEPQMSLSSLGTGLGIGNRIARCYDASSFSCGSATSSLSSSAWSASSAASAAESDSPESQAANACLERIRCLGVSTTKRAREFDSAYDNLTRASVRSGSGSGSGSGTGSTG